MRIASLVLGDFEGITVGDVIGVDYGALVCLNKGLTMTLACGDFDSVSQDSYQAILDSGVSVLKLPAEKDDTDFYFAYKQCDAYDLIYVFGGLGGRRDHEYTHVTVAMRDSRVVLLDDRNRIQSLTPGHHTIKKETYDYISFHVMGSATLSLEGFRYPLLNRKIERGDVYLTSNEITDVEGYVFLEGHAILMIQSKA